MKENNLLPDLAAYLYAQSKTDNGRLPSERELAEHFAVSRGQIREVLAILEAMRIVERRAKSGIYLTTNETSVDAMALFARAGVPLDPVQIYETVELRKIHEIKAAEFACSRATEENLDRLRDILQSSERKLAAGETWPARTAISISKSCAPPRTAFFTRCAASITSWVNSGCRSTSRIPSAAAAPMPSISRSSKP
jgi:DNA-binding FadR family transcriptional regulator